VTNRLSLNPVKLLPSMLVLGLVSSLKARLPKTLLDFRSDKGFILVQYILVTRIGKDNTLGGRLHAEFQSLD
jgi:hypothetical protein